MGCVTSRPDRVDEPAEAVAFHGYRIAHLQKARRVEGDTAAGAGSRRDDVTGFQRNVAGDFRHDGGNVKHHVPGAETLALFPVDGYPDLDIGLGHRRVREENPRPRGAERVARLAQEPLGAARSEEHTSELQSRENL